MFKNIICLALLFFIALLSGCSGKHRQDGPPGYNVDVSKIPDAVPKAERPSKYGNLATYRVYGKRYYTLPSGRGYQETGYASWYGTKFHEQRTSSGEKYDMLAMTAAHKTLPLPTYVEVTNLKNNKKVIVKVNDRGPFVGDRLIDLSYVAAKKLGMVGHGTTKVRIQAITPGENIQNNTIQETDPILASLDIPPRHIPPRAIHAAVKQKPSSTIYLQVGAFKNKMLAEKLKKRLTPLVRSPIQITARKLYHVRIGPIKNVATATQITKKLKSIGIKV